MADSRKTADGAADNTGQSLWRNIYNAHHNFVFRRNGNKIQRKQQRLIAVHRKYQQGH